MTAVDGSKTETEIRHAGATGALIRQRVVTTSADGRAMTSQTNNDGNGSFDVSDVPRPS